MSSLSTELQTGREFITMASLTHSFTHFENCSETTSFLKSEIHNTAISPASYELLFGMSCEKDNSPRN